MSLKVYDDALIKKLQSWTNNTDIHIYNSDGLSRVIETLTDESQDSPIKLPLIVIRRDGGFNITNVNKQPTSYDGRTLEATYQKSLQLNQIPISIAYKIDIYTRYQEEADEYIRNIIFNIINFPKLHAEINYQGKQIVLDSTIQLEQDVADNSDVPERFVPGMFTRYTLGITIPDAHIWDVRLRDNIHMGETQVIAVNDDRKPKPHYKDNVFDKKQEIL